MPTISVNRLREAITQIFCALGVAGPEAALLTEHLVEAELAGVTSHGVIRVPQYVQALEDGKVVPDARLQVLSETSCTAVLDGNRGFGQVMARRAMDFAIGIADRTGVGAVTLFRCSHTGRLGSYTEYAAGQGKAALMMVNAGGHGQWVAPYGGISGRLSTNPLSIAVPSGGDFPLVLDIATSVAPEGKVRALRAAGEPIPEGWAVTSDGRSTTDPGDLYGPPRGALLPFGGHKGFGLAVMIEALAGGLSGAGCCWSPEAPLEAPSDGVFMVVFRVEAFCPLAVFHERIQQMIRHIKSSLLAAGFEAVLVPGEPEAIMRARRMREGVPIEEAVWRTLEAVFDRFSVKLL
jgi:uncharacterized oxidoreductase